MQIKEKVRGRGIPRGHCRKNIVIAVRESSRIISKSSDWETGLQIGQGVSSHCNCYLINSRLLSNIINHNLLEHMWKDDTGFKQKLNV